MDPNTKKLMFYLMVMLLTIYPIFELFRKKLKWYVRWPLLGIIVFFFWLALSVRSIEDSEKRASNLKADSLQTQLTKSNDQLIKKTDSINNFLEDLKKQFGVKDSASHAIPIQNYKPIFNTNVGKARDIKIG